MLIVACLGLKTADADVVVFANRSEQVVSFKTFAADASPESGQPKAEYLLSSADVVCVPCRGPIIVEYADDTSAVQSNLADPNCAYFFYRKGGKLFLEQIGLAVSSATRGGRELESSRSLNYIATVPVKIFVDDNQRWKRTIWEPKLRNRVAAASHILERNFRIRFTVSSVGTWDSDDDTTDFTEALSEFQREAKLDGARLAIGFSSQSNARTQGRNKLGGTRGVMFQHILVREWQRGFTESEQRELLVHELGHYLGAAHSPESNSVMRPILPDQQIRYRSFRIRFDPVNALICYLVAEEIRLRDARSFGMVSPGTKHRLREIYSELARAQPDDPVAKAYYDVLRKHVPPRENHRAR